MSTTLLSTFTGLMIFGSIASPLHATQIGSDGLLHFTYHARVTSTQGATDPVTMGDPVLIKMTVDPNFDYANEATLSGGLSLDVLVDGITIYLNGENSGLFLQNGANGAADSITVYTEGGARSPFPTWNGGDNFYMSFKFVDPSGTAFSGNEVWPINYERGNWRDINLFIGKIFTSEDNPPEFTARVPDDGTGFEFLAISCIALIILFRIRHRTT